MSRRYTAVLFCALLGIMAASASSLLAWQFAGPVPQWIWSPHHNAGHVPQANCHFRRTIRLDGAVRSAQLAIAADDRFDLFLNGKRVGEGTNDQGIVSFEVGDRLRQGANVVAVRVSNRNGSTAGLALRLSVLKQDQKQLTFVSDGSWRTSLSPLPLWNLNSYSDRRWSPAKTVGEFSDFVNRQLSQANSNQANSNQANSNQANSNQVGASQGPGKDSEARESQPSRMAQAKPRSVNPSPAGNALRTITNLPKAGGNLEVPREFELEQLAGNQDVGSLIAMTFNEFGHMIVAPEGGSLLLVYDKDKDGRFDTIREYADSVTNCQGVLAMNGNVFVVGTGPKGLGLYRLNDANRDGFLDETKLVLGFKGENLEHGPHGLVLGADGYLYGVVGNYTELDTKVDPASPYRDFYEGDLVQPKLEDPSGHAAGIKAPGGFVFRTDAEGKQVEIVAGGLRNAYDLAVNAAGEIFTHDSDMESDLGTTWSRPTRLYHVVPGAEFGWRSGWSKWPEGHLDGLSGIADTDRGSPAGLTVYEHLAFPKQYRNAIFSCDWSEGKIVSMNLREVGASYRATPETFISGTPLNVTDIEVGPDGALYFVTGGRGTVGNIYRVAWKGHPFDEQILGSGIDRVLRQPQLNSSWARQRIAKLQEQLGDEWNTLITAAALDANRSAAERVQALRVMQWMGPKPSLEDLVALSFDRNAAVRRQAASGLGLISETEAADRLTDMLKDQDAVVQRLACEAIVRSGHVPSFDSMSHLLTSKDRYQTWAARRMLERMPRSKWQEIILQSDNQTLFLQGATAILIADPDPEVARVILDRTLALMNGFISDKNFIDLLRVQQLALLRGNLTRNDVPLLSQRLSEEYPSSSQLINRELVRLLTYLQVGSILDRYLAELETDMPVADRVHLATHLTRIKANWSTDQKLVVFENLEATSEDGNSVLGYLENVARDFGKTLTEQEMQVVLEQGDRVPSAALASLFQLPDQLTVEQIQQIKQLDGKIADQETDTAKRLKVGVVAVLARDGTAESLTYLRDLYERDPSRRVEVALGLAEQPTGENWKILIRSLPLLDKQSVQYILAKLSEQDQSPQESEPYRQVILAAQRLGDDGAQGAISLLEHWQGFTDSQGGIPWQKGVEAWKNWFAETYPDEPLPELSTTSGGKWDYDALLNHLKEASEDGTGSVENGRLVFAKAQCANCHRFESNGESMGPDLTTVSKRFLPQEILDSMIYPSKVISDQYAAKTIITVDGKTYTGLVAPTGDQEVVVLQANGQKVRIPADEIDESEPSRTSAMPEGLIDQLTLEEVTDLFAYLASGGRKLTQKPAKTDRR